MLFLIHFLILGYCSGFSSTIKQSPVLQRSTVSLLNIYCIPNGPGYISNSNMNGKNLDTYTCTGIIVHIVRSHFSCGWFYEKSNSPILKVASVKTLNCSYQFNLLLIICIGKHDYFIVSRPPISKQQCRRTDFYLFLLLG